MAAKAAATPAEPAAGHGREDGERSRGGEDRRREEERRRDDDRRRDDRRRDDDDRKRRDQVNLCHVKFHLGHIKHYQSGEDWRREEKRRPNDDRPQDDRRRDDDRRQGKVSGMSSFIWDTRATRTDSRRRSGDGMTTAGETTTTDGA